MHRIDLLDWGTKKNLYWTLAPLWFLTSLERGHGMGFLRACVREYVNIVHGFVKGRDGL